MKTRMLVICLALFTILPLVHWPQIRASEPAFGNKQNPKYQQAANRHYSKIEPSVIAFAIWEKPEQEPNPCCNSRQYDPYSDHLYRWYLRATVVGVVIGIFGLGFLIKQTNATKKAADAALLNANILLESQRPKITAIGINTLENIFQSDSPRINIGLSNKGMTTAYDCVYETWVELLPFPFEDFTSSAQYFKSEAAFALYPTQEMAINTPLKKKPTQSDLVDISRSKKLLCIRIRVGYRDFKENRVSNFGYFIQYDGLGFLPKYNDCN
jgi:hypothetical protein